MSKVKYTSIFSCQMEAIVFSVLQIFLMFLTSSNILSADFSVLDVTWCISSGIPQIYSGGYLDK